MTTWGETSKKLASAVALPTIEIARSIEFMAPLYTRCLVFANAAFNNAVFIGSTSEGMKPSYKRLLDASSELRGWHKPADIARGLTKAGFTTSEQKMTNWKTRGVSVNACLAVAPIIGCRPQWLLDGNGAMIDVETASSAIDAKEEASIYQFMNEAMREIVELMRTLDADGQRELVGQAKLLVNQQRVRQQNSLQRTGQ